MDAPTRQTQTRSGLLRAARRTNLRFTALLALLVVAALGIGAGGAVRRSPGGLPGLGHAAAGRLGIVFAAAVIAVPLLVTAFTRRLRRRRGVGQPSGPWAPILLAFLLLLASIVLLSFAKFPKLAPPHHDVPGPTHVDGGAGAGEQDTTVWVVLGVAAACVVLAAIWAGRRRTPTPGRLAAAAPDPTGPALHAAARAGWHALRSIDDDRGAVIACYQAMEEALTSHALRASAADTPGEVLSRAVDSGLLRGPAGARLVDLFAAARYSSQPFGRDERLAAERALADIRAELGSRQ